MSKCFNPFPPLLVQYEFNMSGSICNYLALLTNKWRVAYLRITEAYYSSCPRARTQQGFLYIPLLTSLQGNYFMKKSQESTGLQLTVVWDMNRKFAENNLLILFQCLLVNMIKCLKGKSSKLHFSALY